MGIKHIIKILFGLFIVSHGVFGGTSDHISTSCTVAELQYISQKGWEASQGSCQSTLPDSVRTFWPKYRIIDDDSTINDKDIFSMLAYAKYFEAHNQSNQAIAIYTTTLEKLLQIDMQTELTNLLRRVGESYVVDAIKEGISAHRYTQEMSQKMCQTLRGSLTLDFDTFFKIMEREIDKIIQKFKAEVPEEPTSIDDLISIMNILALRTLHTDPHKITQEIDAHFSTELKKEYQYLVHMFHATDQVKFSSCLEKLEDEIKTEIKGMSDPKKEPSLIVSAISKAIVKRIGQILIDLHRGIRQSITKNQALVSRLCKP